MANEKSVTLSSEDENVTALTAQLMPDPYEEDEEDEEEKDD